jgi:glutathione S-transferase/GST-like protein
MIARIPLPERRTAWRKAMFAEFSEAELAESRRRIAQGVALIEAELDKREYVASDGYSLADINLFNSLYGLPVGSPELCGPEQTPNIWRWLKAVYRRPAVQQTWALGQGRFTDRFNAIMAEFG